MGLGVLEFDEEAHRLKNVSENTIRPCRLMLGSPVRELKLVGDNWVEGQEYEYVGEGHTLSPGDGVTLEPPRAQVVQATDKDVVSGDPPPLLARLLEARTTPPSGTFAYIGDPPHGHTDEPFIGHCDTYVLELPVSPDLGLVDADDDEKKPTVVFEIHDDVLADKNLGPAWLAYCLARYQYIEEHFNDPSRGHADYKRTFEEEVIGRQMLADAWGKAREFDPSAVNKYLDELLSIEDAGFIPEYVWTYLRDPSWHREPEQLRHDLFDSWRDKHLKGHEVETPVDQSIELK
jgi:hypothetical protein